jgi:N-methylhydantoinase A
MFAARRKGSRIARKIPSIREIYFDEREKMNAPVYLRDSLAPNRSIEGPAIIEQLDATTLIFPGQKAEIHVMRNIILEVS